MSDTQTVIDQIIALDAQIATARASLAKLLQSREELRSKIGGMQAEQQITKAKKDQTRKNKLSGVR